jgi:hypothetical protein
VSGSTAPRDAIVGYRAFVAVVVAAYFTLIALTPRAVWMPNVSWPQLLPLSGLYLALGIWGFDYARRRSSLLIAVAYLLIEFAIGMRINTLAWGGGLPLILLPLAAQAVILLPRLLAAAMCLLVIAGVSGNLSWVPEWPHWLRNIAQASCSWWSTSASRSASGRHDCGPRTLPLRSHTSLPRTSATAWRARSTTHWDTT